MLPSPRVFIMDKECAYLAYSAMERGGFAKALYGYFIQRHWRQENVMLTQKKKKLSALLLAILYGTLAYADQSSSIGAAQPAIQENLEHQGALSSKGPIVKVEASQALLTYQLVQTLSKETIKGKGYCAFA